MAVQGSPHGYTKSEITEAIKKNHGRVTYAARDLNLHWDTLYVYFVENPDIWEVVEECRRTLKRYKNKSKVELSEAYQNKLLTKKDVPYAVGLRASMYILDSLGEEEGYGKVKDEKQVPEGIEESYKKLMDQVKNGQSARSIDESKIINDAKSE